MITLVSAFVPIPNHPRSEETYHELGWQLRQVDVPMLVRDDARLEDCWLHQFLQYRKRPFTHSVADNPAKNTTSYHIVQAQKSEWLAEAAIHNPAADVLVWVDYGIFSVPGVTADIIRNFMLRAVGEQVIAAPGCWNDDYKYDDQQPCWRFCGGVLVMPRQHVLAYDQAMKREYARWLDLTNNLSWEVNTMARVERSGAVPIWHYRADHDASLFTAYRANEIRSAGIH